MKDRKDLSFLFLRLAIGIVFLYFGYQQAVSPSAWASYIPNFLTGTVITANNLVIFNSIMELSLAIFLILGLYTRFASIVLSVHLIFIALSMGVSPVGVRDFGLAFATFAIFLNGPDRYTADKKAEMHEGKVFSEK